MRIVLIRHFMTNGNLSGRYIGKTDEDLLPLEKSKRLDGYPKVMRVYSSPLKRCLQTSKLIYPKLEPIVINDFRECDFGKFENKNYKELTGNPQYQEWIDCQGNIPFPEGEDPQEFRKRCKAAFVSCIWQSEKDGCDSIAIVVHGGTIMSIMEAYHDSKKSFYDYQLKNGEFYTVMLSAEDLQNGEIKLYEER